MHINLIAHSQVKILNPTPECPNQIYPHVEVFHGLFTSFSRSFHEFFTVLSHALLSALYFSMTIFNLPQKTRRHDFQTTSDNFRSSKCRTGPLTGKRPSFKPVASWQVAGNIPGNMFFYSYLIRRNVEWGSIYDNRCTSFCYIIRMLMGSLCYS